MTTNHEERVLSAIQQDLLREVHKHRDDILQILEQHLKHAEFNASKYKEQECYETLTRHKRAYNVLKSFLKVTK